MNDAYPMVYRHSDRPDLKGRLCRVVAFHEPQFWADGKRKIGTPGDMVALEFEDGTRVEAMRTAVVRVRSVRGRAVYRARRAA